MLKTSINPRKAKGRYGKRSYTTPRPTPFWHTLSERCAVAGHWDVLMEECEKDCSAFPKVIFENIMDWLDKFDMPHKARFINIAGKCCWELGMCQTALLDDLLEMRKLLDAHVNPKTHPKKGNNTGGYCPKDIADSIRFLKESMLCGMDSQGKQDVPWSVINNRPLYDVTGRR